MDVDRKEVDVDANGAVDLGSVIEKPITPETTRDAISESLSRLTASEEYLIALDLMMNRIDVRKGLSLPRWLFR